QLYARRAGFQRLSAGNLQLATGDRIFYKGIDLFPGQGPTFTELPTGVVLPKPKRKGLARFQFRAHDQTLLAVVRPVTIGRQTFGRLVGDVLDLAKLDAHRFTVLREEVEMERLIDRACVTFSEEARRRKIDYRCSVEAKPVIVSDGDRVLQIISNLLSNAFRWTPDGGKIELELKAVDGTVCVAVDDSGPGIPAAERERIFRPFWSRDG